MVKKGDFAERLKELSVNLGIIKNIYNTDISSINVELSSDLKKFSIIILIL